MVFFFPLRISWNISLYFSTSSYGRFSVPHTTSSP